MISVESVNRGIATLEQINPNNNYAYEEALLAFVSIQSIPFLIQELDFPFTVCRARTHEEDIYFQNVSEISIAPDNVIKSFARCNRPFQSLFYCSDFRPTSYIELVETWVKGKEKNDKLYVTISKWEINKPLNTLIITSPYPEERNSPYDKGHGPNLDHFINEREGDEKLGMLKFYKFLFDRFRKPAKDDPLNYIITTAYCNLAFAKAKENLDAIFYPSVPFQGEGVNFAIKSSFDYETNFKLLSVHRNMFLIKEMNPLPHLIETGIIEASSIKDGKIIW